MMVRSRRLTVRRREQGTQVLTVVAGCLGLLGASVACKTLEHATMDDAQMLTEEQELRGRIDQICPSAAITGQDLEQAVARCYTYQEVAKRRVHLLGPCEVFIILDQQGKDITRSPYMKICVDAYAASHRPVKQFVLRDLAQSLAEGHPRPQSQFTSSEDTLLRQRYQGWSSLSFTDKLDLCVDHLIAREWAYYDRRTDPKDLLEYTPMQHQLHYQRNPGHGLNYVPRDCAASAVARRPPMSSDHDPAQRSQHIAPPDLPAPVAVHKPLSSLGVSMANAVAKCQYYNHPQYADTDQAERGLCEVFAMLKAEAKHADPSAHPQVQQCLQEFAPSGYGEDLREAMVRLNRLIRRPPSSRRRLYEGWHRDSLSAQVKTCQRHLDAALPE